MTNPEVEARWTATLEAVTRDLSDTAGVIVRVPGWQPADLDTGLYWLRMQIYEGFQVGYLVERDAAGAVLWLKGWEEDWDGGEPEWAVVKAIPVAPSNPDQEDW